MKQQLIFILAFFAAITLNAQNAMLSSGGEAIGTGGSSSFSYGLVEYSFVGTNINLTEGVQQSLKQNDEVSYVKYIANKMDELEKPATIAATVYPNPTVDHVVLALNNNVSKNLSYTIFDFSGRAVANGVIKQINTTILFSNLLPGAYTLNVYQQNDKLSSFIIIKN